MNIRLFILLVSLCATVFSVAQPTQDFSWSDTLSAAADQIGHDAHVDGAGNVYTCGRFQGTIIFETGTTDSIFTSDGGYDAFVAKYDANGNVLWANRAGGVVGPADEEYNGITVDPSGDVYVAGAVKTDPAIIYGGDNANVSLPNNGNDDAVLVKYDGSTGDLLWVEQPVGSNADIGRDVVADGTHVYFTGTFRNDLDWDGSAPADFPSVGGAQEDVFLARYTFAGVRDWEVRAVAGQQGQEVYAIIEDGGFVYMTGAAAIPASANPCTFNGPPDVSFTTDWSNDDNIWTAQFNKSNGRVQWVSLAGSDLGDDAGMDLVIEGGNLYVTGYFEDTLNTYLEGTQTFNDRTLGPGGFDIFILEYDLSGNKTDLFIAGGTAPDFGTSITAGGPGEIIIGGAFRGTASFDGNAIVSDGGADAFAASYTTLGVLNWFDQISGTGNDSLLSVHSNGSSFGVTGTYNGGNLTIPTSPPTPSNPWNGGWDYFVAESGTCTQPAIGNNIIAADQSICAGDVPAMLTGTLPTGGDGSYTYLWERSYDLASWEPAPGANTLQNYSPPALFNVQYFRRTVSSGCVTPDVATEVKITVNPAWPAWAPTTLCETDPPFDLTTLLHPQITGTGDLALNNFGVVNGVNLVGAQDGSYGEFYENGDQIVIDLTDTVPQGQFYNIIWRQRPGQGGTSTFDVEESIDNVAYGPFNTAGPFTTTIETWFITTVQAEAPTRFVRITAGSNIDFEVDAITYLFEGTPGGSWSGHPSIAGDFFDPSAAGAGSYNITYTIGAGACITDSTNTIDVVCCAGPSITVCQNDTTITADPACNYSMDDFTGNLTVTDNCGSGITVTQSIAQFTGLTPGVYTIAMVATDGDGNTDTCWFDLTITADVNPIPVSCGDSFIGATTNGFNNNGDGFSCVGFGTPGEDVYYQISVPTGNHLIQITMDNVVDSDDNWAEVFWVGAGCPLGSGCLDSDYMSESSDLFSNGTNTIQYLATGPGTYYFVVDGQNSGIDSYDIAFDCIVSGVEFDESCGPGNGDVDSDGVIPTINGGLTTEPCESVTVCLNLLVANINDWEWMDSVEVQLGSCYTNVTNFTPNGVNTGWYQGGGDWLATYDGPSNTIVWDFNNPPSNFGDGYSGNYSCTLGDPHTLYDFCFDADIAAGCDTDTNLYITITIADDGVGGSGATAVGLDIVLMDDFSITNVADAGFNYLTNSYCQAGADPTPTITGTTGGTFTGPPGIVFTDGSPSSSGEIDVSASTIGGPYTISYSVGLCPTVETFDVSITATDDPTFTYPSSIYCQTGTDPTPTPITGGGSYTGPAGVVFTDGSPSASGTIDLSSSTPGGPYTITYTTGGTCAAAGTFNITIEAPQDATFSYPSAIYCQTAADPVPTPATPGGTWTGPVGINFTDGSPSSTGTIDLSTSTPGGPYTITYTTPNSCAATGVFNITIETDQDATFSYPSATYCATGTDPIPTPATAGGTWTGPAGIIFTDGTPSPTGTIDLDASTPGGPYTITYTTPNSCAATGTFNVSIETPPDPGTNGAVSICATGATVNLIGQLGGSPDAGGVWTGPAPPLAGGDLGTFDPSINVAGTYTYTVTGTACPGVSADVVVTITPAPDAGINGSHDFCSSDLPANLFNDLGGTPDNGGAWTGPSVLSGGDLGTFDPATNVAGVYTYTVSAAGCANATSNVTVTIETAPDAGSNGSITYCVTDPASDLFNELIGTPDNGGSWSGPSSLTGGDMGTFTPGTNTAGTYTYAVSGTNCPTAAADVVVTVNPTQDGSFAYSSSAYCNDATNPVPTPAVPGGSWTGPVGIVFTDGSPSPTGTIDLSASTPGGPYTISYTTPGPCAGSNTFDITIIVAGDPSFNYGASAYCQGDPDPTPTITGDMGGSFTGDPGIVFTDGSPSLTGTIDLAVSSVGGPYNITYTTGGACSNSTTFAITINAEDDPSFTYSSTAFCPFDSNPIPTISGTGGGIFTEGSGNIVFVSTATGEIDVAASTVGGPYTITYTTPGPDCPNSTTWNITISNPDDASFSYPFGGNFCQDGTDPTPVITGVGGGTFSEITGGVDLDPSTGQIDLDNSSTGSFWIVYTTPSGGCQNADSVLVNIIAVDDPGFSYPDEVCITDPSNPVATITGTPGGTFTEGTGTVVFVDVNTGEIDLASTPPGTYTITYTTSGACPDSDTEDIDLLPAIDPVFWIPDSICLSNPVINMSDSTILNPGESHYFYSYGPTGGASLAGPDDQNLQPNLSGPGDYFVTHVVDNGTCMDSLTLSVSILPDFNANWGNPDTICEAVGIDNLNLYFNGSTDAGGSWFGTGVFNDSLWNVTGLGGGSYSISYTVGVGMCSDTVTKLIYVAPDVDTGWVAPGPMCESGAVVDLTSYLTTATAGGSWSGPGVTGTMFDPAAAGPGNHNVTYSVGLSPCAESLTQTITVLEDAIADAGLDASECGLNHTFSATTSIVGGGTWSGPAGSLFTPNANDPGATVTAPAYGTHTYYWTVDQSGLCTDIDSVEITFVEMPTADAGPDQYLDFIFETNLDAMPPSVGSGVWTNDVDDGFIWDPTDPASYIDQLGLGANVITWTVTNGVCPAVSDEVVIYVNDIFIPQAVTPNGDGQNDLFVVYGLDQVDNQVQIFNRWGQVIFESVNYQNDWSGRNMDGDELANDTYFYLITIEQELTYEGYVVVKR